jgi:hypothetical protein
VGQRAASIEEEGDRPQCKRDVPEIRVNSEIMPDKMPFRPCGPTANILTEEEV